MPRRKLPRKGSDVLDQVQTWRRERPDLDPADYLYIAHAIRLGRVLQRIGDQLFEQEFDLSGAEMRVLFALRRVGSPYALRPTDLFRAVLVTSGAITKQVDRLVAAGLVKRLPDPTDGGGSLVALTKLGVRTADAGMDLVAGGAVFDADALGFSRADREALASLCERVLAALEPSPLAE